VSLLATALSVVGAVHLLTGVRALVAPGFVREVLPARYADAVGGRDEWRGFGAGVKGSLFVVAWSLAA